MTQGHPLCRSGGPQVHAEAKKFTFQNCETDLTINNFNFVTKINIFRDIVNESLVKLFPFLFPLFLSSLAPIIVLSNDGLLLKPPAIKTLATLGDRAAPKLWNTLPQQLKQIDSLTSLKTALKTYFSRLAFNELINNRFLFYSIYLIIYLFSFIIF